MWILTWLKSWFVKEDLSIYNPKERIIFSYLDGEKIVRADPQVLYRALMDVAPELSADIATANSESKFWKTANEAADRKVRAIFSVKSCPEGGLSELELFDLLNQFINYCDQLKKKLNPSQTSSRNTVVPKPSSKVENPPMPSSSASGSTVSGGSTSTQEPQPTESKLPSASSSLVSPTMMP